MKPAVTILTSYYNGERFLETFLKNFKEQTLFSQTELVFVGCLLNDNERFILNQFQKENPDNIKIIELKELKTQSECWNLSIKESSADYLCIWNIDDVRGKYSIENQYKKLLAFPNLGATYGYFIISNKFNNREGKLIDHSKYGPKEYTRSMLLGPFFMFRKSLCKKIGYFDESLKSGSDFDFAIRLAANSDIKMIHSVDGFFLNENNGLSTRNDGVQVLERTVIELRYGILDKIETQYIQKAKALYDIENLTQYGKKIHVSNLVKDYEEFKRKNLA